MISFQKFDGPFGIPIYHQKMPEIIKSVSMSWVVFVGSADDETVGLPGLYHWFEHVPFRGTRKYPNGYSDIKGRFTKYGGQIGAWTRPEATSFHAHVPKRAWKEALSVITDLWAQPLLDDNGIEAERQIIAQELQQKLSSNMTRAHYQLPKLFWDKHPLGHPVIGDELSLKQMNPAMIRQAHNAGYDRSRVALIIIGNISNDEIVAELESLSSIFPDNGLSTRRNPVSHDQLSSWQNGKIDIIDTDFTSSAVTMAFPIKISENNRKIQFLRYTTLCNLFAFGNTSSPLYKILREERNLVYSANVNQFIYSDGGYLWFTAETKREHIDQVIEAFKTVLNDKTVCSEERLMDIKDGISSSIDMQSIDTTKYRETFIQRFLSAGETINDADYVDNLMTVTTEDVGNWMGELTPYNARTLIFRGK